MATKEWGPRNVYLKEKKNKLTKSIQLFLSIFYFFIVLDI